MNIRNWFRPTKAAPDATSTGTGYGALLNPEQVSPGVDLTNYLEAYKVSPWTMRCVLQISQACASVKLKLVDAADNEIEKHPLLDTLARMNDVDNYPWVCGETIGYTHLAGNAYWRLDNPTSPLAIYPLRPDRVTIKPGRRGVARYEYKSSPSQAKGEMIPANEVIHFRTWHPTNDWYGLPTLCAIETSINTDKHVREFHDAFLKNSATPSGALSTPPGVQLPDAEKASIKESFAKAFSGSKNAGKTLFLGPLTWTPMGEGMRDGQGKLNVAKLVREEILAEFGVPPVVVGLLDGATYANSEEQKRLYWSETILGYNMTQYLGRLNEDFCPRWGDGLHLVPDLEAIEALQENREAAYGRLAPAVGIPFLTPNEARKQLGLEPVGPEGDVIYVPMSVMPLGEERPAPALPPPAAPETPQGATSAPEEAPQEAAKPPAAGAETPPAKRLLLPGIRTHRKARFGDFGSPEHEKAWRGFIGPLSPVERDMQRRAGDLYLKALDDVVAALEPHKRYKATTPNIDAILLQVFNDDLRGEWVDELMPGVHQSLDIGADHALAQIGNEAGMWSITNPRVAQYLRDKQLLIKTLPDTQFAQIRGILVAAQETGGTIQDMTRQLQDLQEGYRYYQAERVARTETMGAANEGTLECYRQNGVQSKEWLAALDERTRKTHGPPEEGGCNGQVVGIDELFIVGDSEMDCPGDPRGGPGEVCNCRCTMVVGMD
jgi:HK97 family phage portal protein